MLRKKWEEVRKIPDSNLRAAIIRCQDPMLLVKLQVGFRECFADDDQPEGKYFNRSALIAIDKHCESMDAVGYELRDVVKHVVMPDAGSMEVALKLGAMVALPHWIQPLKEVHARHRAGSRPDMPLFVGPPVFVELDGISYYYAHGDLEEAWLIPLDLIDLET